MHLVYMDDSKDLPSMGFSALCIPAEEWRIGPDHLLEMRRTMRGSDGIFVSYELHATDWLDSDPDRFLPRKPTSDGRAYSRILVPMTQDETELLSDIRFALRGLDPWPPKGGARPSDDYARRVLEHLRLCGWEVSRPSPKKAHATP